MKRLEGVIPALVTPVKPDESVDESGLYRLVNYLLNAGVSGIFALGSMGEFATLEDREKIHLLEKVVEIVDSKVPVLAGVSDTGTKKVIKNIMEIKQLGVDAVVALPPFFYLLNQGAVRNFYIDIAEASPLPVVIYHNPGMTRFKFEFDTLVELSNHPNIIGLKDSSCDYEFFLKTLTLRDDNFSVLQGDERRLKEALLAGADGLVTGVGNVAIKIFVDLYKSAKEGDIKEVEEQQSRVNRLLEFCRDSWIQAIKYGLKLQGICKEYVCRPFCPVDEDTKKRVEDTLKEMKIL